MIFTPKIYPHPVAGMILDGRKCQTRRIVKEGELKVWLCQKETTIKMNKGKTFQEGQIHTGNAKVKWQVGRDYAVQLGRGKPCIHWCDACKELHPILLGHASDKSYPLRIKLTGICKERLLDISEEDAKKEGFENKDAFLNCFLKLYKKTKPIYVGSIKIDVPVGWNPEVWVLDFEVKK